MSYFRVSPKPQASVNPAPVTVEAEAEIERLFSPSGPICEGELLAGRRQEVDRLIETLLEPSKHAVVYGERGVGKTSLVNMFWQRRRGLPQFAVVARVQADPSDDYSSLWHKALTELSRIEPSSLQTVTTADGPLNPDSVRRHLQRCCVRNTTLIIDEFDRLKGARDAELTADTIKYLSDYNINCTVIIVGVAETPEELIRNHESLRRSLACVPLRRMRDEELTELVDYRLDRASMQIDELAKCKILRLSCGLPFYAHKIAKPACLAAVRSGSRHIGMAQVNAAIEHVTAELRHTFCDVFASILAGSRSSNFSQVALASALADVDEDGYFSPAALEVPLSRTLRCEIRAASIQRHLTHLASDGSGRLLAKRGRPGSYRYRFRDALVQPYFIMDGLSRGVIEEEEVLQRSAPNLFTYVAESEES